MKLRVAIVLGAAILVVVMLSLAQESSAAEESSSLQSAKPKPNTVKGSGKELSRRRRREAAQQQGQERGSPNIVESGEKKLVVPVVLGMSDPEKEPPKEYEAASSSSEHKALVLPRPEEDESQCDCPVCPCAVIYTEKPRIVEKVGVASVNVAIDNGRAVSTSLVSTMSPVAFSKHTEREAKDLLTYAPHPSNFNEDNALKGDVSQLLSSHPDLSRIPIGRLGANSADKKKPFNLPLLGENEAVEEVVANTENELHSQLKQIQQDRARLLTQISATQAELDMMFKDADQDDGYGEFLSAYRRARAGLPPLRHRKMSGGSEQQITGIEDDSDDGDDLLQQQKKRLQQATDMLQQRRQQLVDLRSRLSEKINADEMNVLMSNYSAVLNSTDDVASPDNSTGVVNLDAEASQVLSQENATSIAPPESSPPKTKSNEEKTTDQPKSSKSTKSSSRKGAFIERASRRVLRQRLTSL